MALERKQEPRPINPVLAAFDKAFNISIMEIVKSFLAEKSAKARQLIFTKLAIKLTSDVPINVLEKHDLIQFAGELIQRVKRNDPTIRPSHHIVIGIILNYIQADKSAALEHFKIAERTGNTSAKYMMGLIGNERLARAKEKFEFAARRGHPSAKMTLGIAYLKGENNLPQDVAKGRKDLETAADVGESKAMIYLGNFHRENNEIEKAIAYYENAARAGNAEAVYVLASTFLDDKTDIDKAVEYLEVAAKIGMAQACALKGEMHEDGKGFPQDLDRAVESYTAGAKADEPMCMFELARVVDTVIVDPTQASFYLRNIIFSQCAFKEDVDEAKEEILLVRSSKKNIKLKLTYYKAFSLKNLDKIKKLFEAHPKRILPLLLRDMSSEVNSKVNEFASMCCDCILTIENQLSELEVVKAALGIKKFEEQKITEAVELVRTVDPCCLSVEYNFKIGFYLATNFNEKAPEFWAKAVSHLLHAAHADHLEAEFFLTNLGLSSLQANKNNVDAESKEEKQPLDAKEYLSQEFFGSLSDDTKKKLFSAENFEQFKMNLVALFQKPEVRKREDEEVVKQKDEEKIYDEVFDQIKTLFNPLWNKVKNAKAGPQLFNEKILLQQKILLNPLQELLDPFDPLDAIVDKEALDQAKAKVRSIITDVENQKSCEAMQQVDPLQKEAFIKGLKEVESVLVDMNAILEKVVDPKMQVQQKSPPVN